MSATNEAARDSYRQVAGFQVPGSETSASSPTFKRRKGAGPMPHAPVARVPQTSARKRRKG